MAEHFLKKYAATNHSAVRGFTKRAISKLLEMRREGNVRELENVVERAVVLASGTLLDADEIPSREGESADAFFGSATESFPTVDELERKYVLMVLQKTGGRRDKASQILGMNRRTLYRKLNVRSFT